MVGGGQRPCRFDGFRARGYRRRQPRHPAWRAPVVDMALDRAVDRRINRFSAAASHVADDRPRVVLPVQICLAFVAAGQSVDMPRHLRKEYPPLRERGDHLPQLFETPSSSNVMHAIRIHMREANANWPDSSRDRPRVRTFRTSTWILR